MKLLGYYTQQGMELAAELLTGTALQITRAVSGSGETPLSAVALAEERQELPMNHLRRAGTKVTLPVTLTEEQAEADYALREVGVYARSGEGEEVLYRLYRLSEPLQIHAGGRLTVRFYLEETVSETVEITVEVTSAGVLVEGDLEAAKGNANGIAGLDELGLVPPEQMPYTYGTEDLEAGVTPLATGHLHFVYQ